MQSLRSRLLRERADALAYTPTCTSENKPFFINLRCFIRLIFRRIETLATSTMSRVDCEPPVRVQQSINKLHNTRLCIVLLWCICFSLLLSWCSVEWRFDTATADSFTTWHMDRVEDIGHYRFLICTVSSTFFSIFRLLFLSYVCCCCCCNLLNDVKDCQTDTVAMRWTVSVSATLSLPSCDCTICASPTNTESPAEVLLLLELTVWHAVRLV